MQMEQTSVLRVIDAFISSPNAMTDTRSGMKPRCGQECIFTSDGGLVATGSASAAKLNESSLQATIQ